VEKLTSVSTGVRCESTARAVGDVRAFCSINHLLYII